MPWQLDSSHLLLADRSNGQSTYVLFDPTQNKSKSLLVYGETFGPSALLSQDGHYMVAGLAPVNSTHPLSLFIWNTQLTKPNAYTTIRFDHEMVFASWITPSKLLAVAQGSVQPPNFPRNMHLYIVDVQSSNRLKRFLLDGRIIDIAPYPDSKQQIILLLKRGSKLVAARFDVRSGATVDISTLTETPNPWHIIWSSPDHIYFWRFRQRQKGDPFNLELLVYSPAQHKLSTPEYMIFPPAPSADASGILWGLKNGKLTSIIPSNRGL
jgi:hypothetical protein